MEFNTYTIGHGNRSVLVQFKLQFGLWQPKFGVWGEGMVVLVNEIKCEFNV